MMKYFFRLVILLAGLAPSVGLGGLIGQPAPPLNVDKWIKGGPLEIKAGTNIYVVEIWNSSSAPCCACIPGLTSIQRHFKTNGVVVVGVTDEAVDKIQAFAELNTTNLDYAIAADNKRHTTLSYMTPVQERGIPYFFVVGTNGDLLWHSPSLKGLAVALNQITRGTYDEPLAKKMDLAKHQMEQYVDLSRRGSDRAVLAGRTLLATRTNDVELLCDLAFEIAKMPIGAKRDFALANQALARAAQLAPTNSTPVGITRAIVLFESGQRDAGLDLARHVFASAEDSLVKTNLQSVIHDMEVRLARIKSNQAAAKPPNPDSATNQTPAVNAKPGDSGRPSPGKESDGKP
jgi:hypothetical protein